MYRVWRNPVRLGYKAHLTPAAAGVLECWSAGVLECWSMEKLRQVLRLTVVLAYSVSVPGIISPPTGLFSGASYAALIMLFGCSVHTGDFFSTGIEGA